MADLVNLSSSITLKCLISEKMIPKALSYLAALGIFNRMPKGFLRFGFDSPGFEAICIVV